MVAMHGIKLMEALHEPPFRPRRRARPRHRLGGLSSRTRTSTRRSRPWLKQAQINRDRNLRLQYLAGMGLNLDQAGLAYPQERTSGLDCAGGSRSPLRIPDRARARAPMFASQDRRDLRGFELVAVPEAEPWAANVALVGKRRRLYENGVLKFPTALELGCARRWIGRS